jgi:hypothetical protein
LLKQTEAERAKFFYELTYGHPEDEDVETEDETKDKVLDMKKGMIKSLYFKGKPKRTFDQFMKDVSLSEVEEDALENEEDISFRKSTDAIN